MTTQQNRKVAESLKKIDSAESELKKAELKELKDSVEQWAFREKDSVHLNRDGVGHIGREFGRNGDDTRWETFLVINSRLQTLGTFESLEDAEAAAPGLLQRGDHVLVAVAAGDSSFRRYERLVTYLLPGDVERTGKERRRG
jgi:hypothetical protein